MTTYRHGNSHHDFFDIKYVKSITKILGYLGKEIYLQHKLRL